MMENIRERILSEALMEINRDGADFHMDELARRLRISKRTLYEQFSSKQEIIQAALYSLIDDVYDQHVKLLADTSLSTEEKIIRFFHVQTRRVKAETVNMLSVRKMNDVLAKMPELRRLLEQRSRQDWQLLEQLLDKAAQEPAFKPFDKFLVLHMLHSTVDDIIEYFDEVEHDYTFFEYMEKCICVILYGIKTDRGQHTNDTQA